MTNESLSAFISRQIGGHVSVTQLVTGSILFGICVVIYFFYNLDPLDANLIIHE